MKVSAFVLNLRKEFENKRQSAQPVQLNIIESIEEKLADAELTRLLTQHEASQKDVNPNSTAPFSEYLEQRDKVVGKQYDEKNHFLNEKCAELALQISITTGKRQKEILMPGAPKKVNPQTNKHFPDITKHHIFDEKVFLSKLLKDDVDFYTFENFQNEIKTKEQLLEILENYVLSSEWSLFLSKIAIDKLTTLLLGQEVKNYDEFLAKLGREVTSGTLKDIHYYCLTFLYMQRRAGEPELVNWTPYVASFFVSNDNRRKKPKLDVSKEILTALEKQNREVIFSDVEEISKKPAADNGFIRQLIDKLKIAFAPEENVSTLAPQNTM